MSAADWWRTGYAQEFVANIGRIAASLEKQGELLERIAVVLEAIRLEGLDR